MKINLVQGIIAAAVIEPSGQFTRRDLPPGSAEWSMDKEGKITSLILVCPGGCGNVVPIAIERPGVSGWKWNGLYELPSLTPSLQMNVHCRWHGYLTNGEFISC